MKKMLRIGMLLGLPALALLLCAWAAQPGARAQAQTPTNTCLIAFGDVTPDAYFYDPVLWLACRNIVGGYPDGTYHPYSSTTRGQLTKIVVNLYGWPLLNPTSGHFSDVPPGSTFYPSSETAVARGIIGGYADGTFRPSNSVNRGAISKIVTLAAGWTVVNPPTGHFSDVAPGSTYYTAVETAAAHGIIGGYADGTFAPYNDATRGQVAKIVYRAFNLGCPIFPPDNIWNKDISAQPTHTSSGTWVSSIGAGTNLHPDFGSGTWEGSFIGIPWTSVAGSQPGVPINFTAFGNQSDPGPYPIPTNAPIEGMPGGSDRHVLVIDQAAGCTLYELYSSYPQANGSWDAASGAKWNLQSNALRPDTWTSADAAGLPILAGLVRYEEVQEGVIRHAFRFTANNTRNTYIWPARHQAGAANTSYPPMGARFRLKAGVDISTYPPQDQVILTALKHYGMILADNGSDWFLSGTQDERWDNDMLSNLGNLQGSDFEAVDESGLMIDPNSGQSR
jgi:hypothetical protein